MVVAGNHDLLVLGRLPREDLPDYGLAAGDWTREVLRDDVRSYLAQLPQVAERGTVVVAHGSLSDPREYVLTDERAAAQVTAARQRGSGIDTLVLGHTHQQWLWDEWRSLRDPPTTGPLPLRTSVRLVNPGSVGQSRKRERVPLTCGTILDLDQACVTFLALHYDVDEARTAARRAGLDRCAVHAPLSRAPNVRRVVRRVGRRLADLRHEAWRGGVDT